MHLLALSDLHGDFPPVATLPDADAAVIAGDLTEMGWGYPQAIDRAAEFVGELTRRYERVFWIPGNHDIGVAAGDLPGTCLQERLECWNDLRWAGIALTTCFDAPHLKRYWTHMTERPEVDAAAFGALAPAEIVIAHSPPRGCLDDAYGTAIGSPGLLDYIERVRPRLVVCGHCHEGAWQGPEGDGLAWLGETLVVNAAGRVRCIGVDDAGARLVA